jgi:hypothetical protein
MRTRTKPAEKANKQTVKPAAKLTKAQAEAAIKMVNDAKASSAANPKEAVKKQIDAAAETGMWMVAIWRVADSQIHLERTTMNFPSGDKAEAIKMLQRNLSKAK